MKQIDNIIKKYEKAVVQIATPHSKGMGFYLPAYGLIVTNEHVIRDNKEVVVVGLSIKKQLAKVVYLDIDFDLAFLTITEIPELEDITFSTLESLSLGSEVMAIGYPYGMQFSITKGVVSNMEYRVSDINYIQHDAALNPGNSGGPLLNNKGEILGINTFVIKNGNNIGFSLPATILKATLEEYSKKSGELAIRCTACNHILFEESNISDCHHCGAKVCLISSIKEYEPLGVNRTIETMIGNIGYDVRLTRTGPRSWAINKGSARILISYHEKSGLITGDAYLCKLPDNDILDIYNFLLTENYNLDGLTFSVKENDIILSLLIFDQYFNEDTAQLLFEKLFASADHYDNTLVEKYGGQWDSENQA